MLITNIRVVNPTLLTAIFRANDIIGERESIEKIRPVGNGESSTADYYRLALQYKDFATQRHAPDTIFLKITHPNQPEAIIRQEVNFYEQVFPAMLRQFKIEELATPMCYDAYFDDITGRSHIILEDLSGEFKPSRENVPPTQRHREQIIDALARIHAFWWEHEDLSKLAPIPTVTILEGYLEQYQAKFAAMMDYSGAAFMPARHKEILKKIAEKIPERRKDRLVNGKGITIVHSDLHPNNLMYSHCESRIIDWQSWRVDTATDDLAYMMLCFWPQHLREFQEKHVLRRYFDQLIHHGVREYTWDDLQYDYAASAVRCIAFLLAAWTPQKHVRGYWKRAENALEALDKLDAMVMLLS